MTRNIGLTAQQVAASGTKVISTNPDSGPLSIESLTDEAISVVGVLEEIKKGENEKVDAYIIACFGDPGLYPSRELTKAPVIGIAEAAFHLATLVATNFTIVTTLQRTCHIAERLLQLYGFENQCKNIRATDIPVLDLLDDDAKFYDMLLTECQLAKDEDKTGAIVLGCGGMSGFTKQLQEELQMPVIDGVTAAVKLAESIVNLGLYTSKRGTYEYPPKKIFTGSFKHFSS